MTQFKQALVHYMNSIYSNSTVPKSTINNGLSYILNHKQINSWLGIFVFLLKILSLIFIVGIILFCFKQVNLYRTLNLPTQNNFLDLILSGSDLILIPYLVVNSLNFWFKKSISQNSNITLLTENLIKSKNNPTQIFADSLGYREEAFAKYKINSKLYHILLASLATWLVGSTLSYSIQAPATGLLLQSLRLLTWLLILPKLPNNLKLVLGLYSLFDHFLISSSLPAIITSVLFGNVFGLVKKFKPFSFDWKKYLVIIVLILNFAAASHQVFVGRSLGLPTEPQLDVRVLSQIARQGELLRGYGLTQHPNILGGLALIILAWAMNQKLKYSPFIGSKKPNILGLAKQLIFNFKQSFGIRLILTLATLCLILSFSRLAWLSLFLLWWYKLLTSTKQPNWFLTLKIIVGFGLVIGWFSVFRKDIYRIQDWQLWLDSFWQLPLVDKIIGSGYYPQYLANNFNSLESWRWQPVHNVWMNISFEFGIIGLIMILILVWQSITVNKPKYRNSN